MKFFDKEFIEALTLRPQAKGGAPINFAEMDEIALVPASAAATDTSSTTKLACGCDNGGTCGSVHADTVAPFDPSGIKAMLTEMFSENSGADDANKADLTQDTIKEITDKV